MAMSNTTSRLTAADLKGRGTLSYLRFSSSPQEKGTSIERQQETLDRIIAAYGLLLDQSLTDKAMSASKGVHRKKGKLADLLKAIDEGENFRGKVLTIEATDRLFREGMFDAWPVLETIIRKGGMILVTGDLTIWDEAAIDSPLVHKLIAEINAGRDYAKRLAEMATGAHVSRRKRLQALAENPDSGAKPFLNSAPPSWIIRAKGLRHGDLAFGTVIYSLHPERTAILREIFDLAKGGFSCMQIAAELNRRQIPPFSNGSRSRPLWADNQIGVLLRNEAAIGFVQPCRVVEGNKREPVGQRVRLYPPAVDDATWITVRALLIERRKGLRGPQGKNVANLFTGHVFCKTCGSPMRVISGGTRGGKRLVCARWEESRTCRDSERYDIAYWEPRLLHELSLLAPRLSVSADAGQIAEELATLKIEIKNRAELLLELAKNARGSPTRMAMYDKMTDEHDADLDKAAALEIKLSAASSPQSRAEDTWAFFRSLIVPVLAGDIDARLRLRSLATGWDYRITGSDRFSKTLVITVAGREHELGDLD